MLSPRPPDVDTCSKVLASRPPDIDSRRECLLRSLSGLEKLDGVQGAVKNEIEELARKQLCLKTLNSVHLMHGSTLHSYQKVINNDEKQESKHIKITKQDKSTYFQTYNL